MSSLLHTAMANASINAGYTPASPGKLYRKLSSEKDKERDKEVKGKPKSDSSEDENEPPRFSLSGFSDDEGDDDEMVELETRPSTPAPAGFRESTGSLSRVPTGRFVAPRDPIRMLPSRAVVRIFLGLDIKTLARCDRVCKRWRKSQTLNYVWFLHARSLTLPELKRNSDGGYINRQAEEDPDYDPYDKAHFLTLFRTPLPSSNTPQWSKRESKQSWKTTFKKTVTRGDEQDAAPDYRVDIDALSSGYVTPAAQANDADYRWMSGSPGGSKPGSGTSTPRSKKEMRDYYKSLQGRKSRGKGNLGGTQRGIKDKGGAGDGEDPFSAPW